MMNALNDRKTCKVIGDPNSPAPELEQDSDRLNGMLSAAGNAPFHYACDKAHQSELISPVPWRVYCLDSKQCRQLMSKLVANGDTTKIPNMLAVASYLLQVTWLPDVSQNEEKVQQADVVFNGTLRNMEHLAAAAAFTQSLLLVGEGSGYRTYWSSGGPLRKDPVLGWLNIPANQILIGSVFLFPGGEIEADVRPGALADKRGPIFDWSRQVVIS